MNTILDNWTKVVDTRGRWVDTENNRHGIARGPVRDDRPGVSAATVDEAAIALGLTRYVEPELPPPQPNGPYIPDTVSVAP